MPRLRSCIINKFKKIKDGIILARKSLSCRDFTDEEIIHFDFGLDNEELSWQQQNSSNDNNTCNKRRLLHHDTKHLIFIGQDQDVSNNTELTIDCTSSSSDEMEDIYNCKNRSNEKEGIYNLKLRSRTTSEDTDLVESQLFDEDEDDHHYDNHCCSHHSHGDDDVSNITQRSVRFGDEVNGQQLEIIYEVARLVEKKRRDNKKKQQMMKDKKVVDEHKKKKKHHNKNNAIHPKEIHVFFEI